MDTTANTDAGAPAEVAAEGELVSLRWKKGLPLVALMAVGIIGAPLLRSQAPAVVVPFYVVLAAGATYFGLSWAFGALRLASHNPRSRR